MRLTRDQMKRLTPEEVYAAEALLNGPIQFEADYARARAIIEQLNRCRCHHCDGQGYFDIATDLGRKRRTRRQTCRTCLGAGYFYSYDGRYIRKPKTNSK